MRSRSEVQGVDRAAHHTRQRPHTGRDLNGPRIDWRLRVNDLNRVIGCAHRNTDERCFGQLPERRAILIGVKFNVLAVRFEDNAETIDRAPA